MVKSGYVKLKIVQIIIFYLCITLPNPIGQRRMNFQTVKNRRSYGPNLPIICGIDSYEDDMYGCQEYPDDVATTRTLKQPTSECTTQSEDNIMNTKTTTLQQFANSNTHPDDPDHSQPLKVVKKLDDHEEKAKITTSLQPLDQNGDLSTSIKSNTTTTLITTTQPSKATELSTINILITTSKPTTPLQQNLDDKEKTKATVSLLPLQFNISTTPLVTEVADHSYNNTTESTMVTEIFWYSGLSPKSYPTLPVDENPLCVGAKCEYVNFPNINSSKS